MCFLGNAALTTVFEGQTDHLVPVLSTSLIDSDLVTMAGRMIGHSVINGGLTLSGLSPAVADALIYSTKEMAASKLCLEDCSDVEHRETIRLVSEENCNLYSIHSNCNPSSLNLIFQVQNLLFMLMSLHP